MKPSAQKIVIISLSKSKSSPFSLVNTKDDDGETEPLKEKIQYESLSKKLVLYFLI